MIYPLAFDEVIGPQRFLAWSKENELWRTFYRTTIAGHWLKDDVDEFNSCGCFYEIHLQHGNDDTAHLFCQLVIERSDNFKAAKVSKIAVNDMKVIVLLGKSQKMKDKIAHLAKMAGFELARLRSKSEFASENEQVVRRKFKEYLDSLTKAFAPMAANRAKRGG